MGGPRLCENYYKMNKISLLFIVILLCGSCGQINSDQKVRDAVCLQMKLYPESTLQDLYKAFFQAEFGAEHIVADTSSAGRYLDRELLVTDKSELLYEPIGADSSYFRVHLSAVQKGYITRNELFDAFIGGVHQVEIPQIEKWSERWPEIEVVISSLNLSLPGYSEDKIMIDSVLSGGNCAIHHSEHFSEVYDPHYRIIRKDMFLSMLKGKLENQR